MQLGLLGCKNQIRREDDDYLRDELAKKYKNANLQIGYLIIMIKCNVPDALTSPVDEFFVISVLVRVLDLIPFEYDVDAFRFHLQCSDLDDNYGPIHNAEVF